MAGPVCPSCGVAVLPGYVRCPKCRKPLPRRTSAAVQGGTAVDTSSKGPLIVLLAVAIIGAGVIAYIGLRSSGTKAAPAPIASPAQPESQPETTPEQPTVETPAAPSQPAAPDPGIAADRLEKALQRERLWSTVSVEGVRIDVRSSSCSDPKMAGFLDGAAPSFKAAGLTRLRCLEQSGHVVSDRDL
jgi:hypothetical protein